MRSAAILILAVALVAADETPSKKEGGRSEKTDGRFRKTLTLIDAVDLGLAYNLGLESERLNAVVARIQIDVEAAAWDPLFNADVGGGEQLIPSRSSLAGASVVDTDDFAFALGVQKPLRIGGSLGFNWRSSRTFTNSTFSTINPAYDSALDMTFTLPLWRGSGRRVNESNLRIAQFGADGPRQDLVTEVNTVITEIASAYWDQVAAQERVKLLQKSLDVAEEVEASEIRKARPEVGRSTALDVAKARAETQRRVAELIKGRRDEADSADALRKLILPFTGDPVEDALVFTAIDRPAAEGAPRDLDDVVVEALAQRPEILRNEADLKRSQESILQARDATNPELDLSSTVTSRGVADEFNMSATDTLKMDTISAEAALAFRYTFGMRSARAALRQAELELERIRIARAQLVNEIVIEVRRAHRNVSTARDEIEATTEEVQAAELSLDGERKRLQRGSSTVLNVSIFEEDLTTARLSLLQAHLDLALARIELQRATGVLLDNYRIRVDDDLRVTRDKS